MVGERRGWQIDQRYEMPLSRLNAPLKRLTIGEHSFPMTTWLSPRLHLSPWLVYPGVGWCVPLSPKFNFSIPLPRCVHGSSRSRTFGKWGAFAAPQETWCQQHQWEGDSLGRNLASTGPESSNSLVAPMAPPVALNYLELFVMGGVGRRW